MKVIKSLFSYLKIIFLYLTGKSVKAQDYKNEYNIVAPTYQNWLNRMKKYTDQIIRTDMIINKEGPLILDFACGTGYITDVLLKELPSKSVKIVAVDISDKMVEIAKSNITDKRCEFIVQDGNLFLQDESDEKYDAIYCGYALPYFNHKKVIKHFYRILKKGGTTHFILNCKGTLEGIHEIYINTMKKHPSEIAKILEISYQLPKDENDIRSWFENHSFQTLFTNTVEEFVSFNKAEDLYLWLKQTGALAGTGCFFTDNNEIEKEIIDEIVKKYYSQKSYIINHRFILAIFRK